MKPYSFILLALACASPLCAQRYQLKDGRILNQADVVVKDGKLVQTLAGSGGGSAEMTYAFSQVARLDWPEPAELDDAGTLLASGKASEALDKITPIYRQFLPFPSTPGSWWSDAAVLRARALLADKKLSDAESAAREIISSKTDEDAVKAAQLVMAEVQFRLNKASIADAMLDEILKKGASSEIEARAVLLRGDIAFANKQPEKALQFYLQIPVFYGSHDELMPAALLGSARSFKAYGDGGRTERAYLDLINTYPNSAEATAAKAESGL